MPLTEFQLKERQSAIGGSDVLHLVGLEPFGCTRRLWYDKKKVPADFPFRGNRHTQRGSALEDIAKTWYFEHTARGLDWRVPWKLDPDVPYFGVHADALQEIQECGPKSLLEIKIPSARYFYASRNKPDPPNEAMLQAQWGMMCHRLRAGTVFLFSADAWLGKWWDVGNDDHMQSDLRAIGTKFWASLKRAEPPYPKLHVEDGRCRECPWRTKCQGLPEHAGDHDAEFQATESKDVQLSCTEEEANEAILAYIATKANLNDATTQFEIAKAKLMGLFPSEGKIETPFGRAKLKTVYRGEYTSVVRATTYPLLTVKQKVEETFPDGGIIETY